MLPELYTPRPLPTWNPQNKTVLNTMYSSIDDIFNKIVNTLRSIPVIPNSNGLFDSSGHWLVPTLSLFEVLSAFFVMFTFLSLLKHLSTGSGFLGALLRNRNNEN